MKELFGYCRDSFTYYPLPEKFNERKHFGVCPECKKYLILDRSCRKTLLKMRYKISDTIADITSQ